MSLHFGDRDLEGSVKLCSRNRDLAKLNFSITTGSVGHEHQSRGTIGDQNFVTPPAVVFSSLRIPNC